jgi:hypothetical protein
LPANNAVGYVVVVLHAGDTANLPTPVAMRLFREGAARWARSEV